MTTEKKIRVAVFMGGPSAEHAVSLMSGKKIVESLDVKKYVAFPFVISTEGKWPMSVAELKQKCDVALIAAMHGEYGEDGTLQEELKKADIPFTGSGVLASKRGMDKVVSDKIFRRARLLTPQFVEHRKRQTIIRAIRSPFGYPVVVKPSDRGSSVGTTVVREAEDLAPALELAFQYSDRVLIQEFIAGREMTCGVLEIDGREKVLPITEIVPKRAEFFDYDAKYTAGASEEVTPANVPFKITKKIQQAALTAHKAIGCSGYSRSDFIFTPKNELYILEINTLPGMTQTSLLPQAAAAANISFPQLLDLLIAATLS